MRTSFFLIILVLFTSITVQAQPVIQWQRCYGGTNDEEAFNGRQTTDGGYIIAGRAGSHDGDLDSNYGYNDYWIIKISPTDSLEWQKHFGGNGDDQATDVRQTTDGGYIVVGNTGSFDGDVVGNHGVIDVWILKLDDTGGVQWKKCYGGISSDFAYSIDQTPDGGYFVVGATCSPDGGDVMGGHGLFDCWVFKLDDTGALQWQRCLGGSSVEDGFSGQHTFDGGYIVGARTQSADGDVIGYHGGILQDYWLIKLNDTGGIVWQQCYGGTDDDELARVIPTDDGGYIAGGMAYSTDGDVTGNHGDYDYWVIKTNGTGVLQWEKCYGGSDYELCAGIIQAQAAGYVLGGQSRSHDGEVIGNHGIGSYDNWIIHIDDTGAIIWSKCYGGTNTDWADFFIKTGDGGYLFGGSTNSDDGDVSGLHSTPGGYGDYWIVKLKDSISISSVPLSLSAPPISVYPNPASDVVYISTTWNVASELTGMDGKIVIPASAKTELDVSNLPAGNYLLNVYNTSGTKIKTEKILKR